MTNTEAIKVLEQMRQWTDYPKEALMMAIEALSKLSLPSNIDEAAEDGWALYEYRESPKGLYSTCYIDGFKAGAEWMSIHGDVIATRLIIDSEGKVNLSFTIGDITDENCRPKYFAGQDVIVQIRKK